MVPSWVLVVGGVVAVAIAALVAAHRRAVRRREAIRVAGLQMGLEYRAQDAETAGELAGFKLFSRGHSRRFLNALVGSRGALRVALGDWHFITGSGKHRTAREEVVCVVRDSGLRLPRFFARVQIPIFAPLERLIGGQDIDFAEDPGFSRAFVLEAEDEAAVRDLFTATVRAHLMRFAGRWVAVEGGGDAIALGSARTVEPADLPAMLDETIELLGVFAAAAQPGR